MPEAATRIAADYLPLELGPDHLPTHAAFERVCRNGLSAFRPLLPEARQSDKYGWNYGSANPPSYWAYGRLRALLNLGMACELNPSRALEVAAGDAALSATLSYRVGCSVTANDLRREDLERSISLFENRNDISTITGNLFDLDPSSTGLFDLVIACEVVEHVAHVPAFMKHLRRFLTDRGRLLLTTPNGSYFRSNLPTYSEIPDFTALEAGQFKPDADGHQFLMTPSEMRDIARDAGFDVESMLLWGTPFISGESGFRALNRIRFPCYAIERWCQKLGNSVQERLCNNMVFVLRNSSSSAY